MGMIRKRQIDELYEIKTRHDNYPKGFDYQKEIVNKSLSGFLFFNDNMREFLENIRPSLYHFFDSKHIVRNLKNWYVDKYYGNHIK